MSRRGGLARDATGLRAGLARGVFGWLFGCALLFAQSGCAAWKRSAQSAGPLLPATENEWIEIRSTHFQLQTDVDSSQAEELAAEFERSYTALRDSIFPDGSDAPGITQVIVFRRMEHFRQVSPPYALGYFTGQRSLLGWQKRIVFSAVERERSLQIFRHELTHRFVAHYFPGAPRWLNEGLAEFFSTARLTRDTVVLGEPGVRAQHDGAAWRQGNGYLSNRTPQLRDLLAFGHEEFLQGGGYEGAWVLLQVLLNGDAQHRELLERYLLALNAASQSELETSSPELQARRAALGSPEIAKAYEAFAWGPPRPGWQAALRRVPVLNTSRRAMSIAERHVLWGSLIRRRPDGGTAALDSANTAIGSDFYGVEGYLLRAELQTERSRALADVRRALEIQPNHQGIWRALGRLLLQIDASSQEADQVAARLTPKATEASDFLFLAEWEFVRKRHVRALEWAVRARSSDTTCVPCRDLEARAAFKLGKLARAVNTQRALLTTAAEHQTPVMLQRLKKYEAALAEARSAQPAPNPLNQ